MNKFENYNLAGGSTKIPEGLKINEQDIVFNEDDIIITRHMESYYWWEKKNSTNKVSNFCKANAKIEDLKISPVSKQITFLEFFSETLDLDSSVCFLP